MRLEDLKGRVSDEAFDTFDTAWKHSEDILKKAGEVATHSLDGSALDPSNICIAAVGSVARREAMTASDIDLIPIWKGDPKEFPHFNDLTGKVREDLRRATGLDVSTSRDLMRSTQLTTLRKADGIGGDQDYRRTLTQRMLILSESSHLAGGLSIEEVRREILEAYVGDREIERTVSRHPLAVCNDIARYYRTLCVDYKSRAETKPESWAERHAKLRNARKLWYFGTLVAISKNVADIQQGQHRELFDTLAKTLSLPPILRLFSAADGNALNHAVNVLNIFAKYLSDMGDQSFRDELSKIDYESREAETLSDGQRNRYRDMDARAREMSSFMIEMLLSTEEKVRRKAFNWFFL